MGLNNLNREGLPDQNVPLGGALQPKTCGPIRTLLSFTVSPLFRGVGFQNRNLKAHKSVASACRTLIGPSYPDHNCTIVTTRNPRP